MTDSNKRPKIIVVSTTILLFLTITQCRFSSAECFGSQPQPQEVPSRTTTELPIESSTENVDSTSVPLVHNSLADDSSFIDTFQQSLYDNHLEFALDMFDKVNKKVRLFVCVFNLMYFLYG